MDTRVKERLTGATILVALIVLLVPELLTGPIRASSAVLPSRTMERAPGSYSVELGEGETHQQVAPSPAPPQAPSIASVTDEPLAAKLITREPSPVEPAIPEAPPVHAAAADLPPVTGWSIQLGSFQSRDNAQRLLRELKGKGFSAFILEGGGTSGKLYRVRAGPAADRAAAAALAAELREIGQPGSIVPYP